MTRYIVEYEAKFNMTGRGTIISLRWQDYGCGDIKKDDIVVIKDEGEYEVTGVEFAKKSFGMIGDNMLISIKKIINKEITHIRFPNESYYDELTTFNLEDFTVKEEFENEIFGDWLGVHVSIKREDYDRHKLLENE